MPPRATVGPEGNPFLFLGGMGQALDILAAEMSAADTGRNILDAYPGISYVAEPDRSSSGSVIRLAVEGDDPKQVTAALEELVALVPVTLTSMQDAQNVPQLSRIGLMTLVVEDEPTEDTKVRTVSVVAAAGGGIALSVLLTGFIDGRLLARAMRLPRPRRIDGAPGLRRPRRHHGAEPAAVDLEAAQDSTAAVTLESRGAAGSKARG